MSYWKNWHPVISDPTTSTLAQIKNEMIGDESVEFIVYLFENPASPLCLSGATSLFAHDCLHILLRRGLLAQDEAFVIGFSMGTDTKTKWWDIALFKFLSKYLYPKYYKFSVEDFKVFDLGMEYAKLLKSRGQKNLHKFPFKKHQNKTIKDLSIAMGIDLKELNEFRLKEQTLLPNSEASKRLVPVTEQTLEEDIKEREDKFFVP